MKEKDRSTRMSEFCQMVDIYDFAKILWFRRMEKIMCNGDYFVMHTLFNFEPVKGFKCRSNVGMLTSRRQTA